ncbi:ArsR family transcriptional regulator [Parapedobacter sp. 10938]|uniref:ArsR family transcriptional regulator n=1 Tax=Parapedobacter flavus TaxID=3110225 RepID=UPI002DBA24ED|nr:ArsR family transcriptional regulator [Parapedobacter sp. 10938]MEC3880106.1 ArsR family transcriptional regulator [Parapedobacter sp. 10938]
MLDSLITSKTRLRLLVKFFINAANRGHMRGLADEFNESTNAIRRELNNLSDAGYLQKEAQRNRVSYRANTQHPLFGSLQDIVHKYLGLDRIVETVLQRMGEVDQVVLTGDYAEGRDTGTIEVTIVGPRLNADYLEQLAPKVEGIIHRQVAFTLSGNPPSGGLVLFEQ